MDNDRDDISSEWATLKSLPGAKALAEDVDLRGELQGMLPHPEFIYKFVEENFGLRYMSIWRCKCFGQKIVHRVYARPTDCWIVRYDVMLWKGEKGTGRGIAPDIDLARVFSTPKKKAYVTLEEVTAAFEVVRDAHLERYRSEICTWRESIAKLENEIAGAEDLITKMTGFVPKVVYTPDMRPKCQKLTR